MMGLLVLAALGGVTVAVGGTFIGFVRSLFDRTSLPSLPTTTPTARPTGTAPPNLAIPTAVIPPVVAPVMTSAYKSGYCVDSPGERTDEEYRVTRNSGSAPSLRGRVAAVHVMLGGGVAAWPRSVVLKIEQAALLSQRFYLDQAQRYGVTDLVFDPIAWQLFDAKVDFPKLTVDGRKRLGEAVERQLHDDAQKAIENAVGVPLETVVVSYRQRGYASVGFFIHIPVTTEARDFAMRATAGHSRNKPEIVIMFPRVDSLADLAVVVSHEGFHLFGADDLYRMRSVDRRDAHDVMGEYCSGFKQATVGDATAYAIGWRATPPDRPYRFLEK